LIDYGGRAPQRSNPNRHRAEWAVAVSWLN
jgi:hypothetical protein